MQVSCLINLVSSHTINIYENQEATYTSYNFLTRVYFFKKNKNATCRLAKFGKCLLEGLFSAQVLNQNLSE